MPQPEQQPADTSDPDAAIVAQVLADCGGNMEAALLLLANLYRNARQGMSAGMLRLPPAQR